jgi:hypothetical protein
MGKFDDKSLSFDEVTEMSNENKPSGRWQDSVESFVDVAQKLAELTISDFSYISVSTTNIAVEGRRVNFTSQNEKSVLRFL